MRQILAVVFVAASVILACSAGGDPGQQQSSSPSYAADIEPIFQKRCGDCHSVQQAKAHLVLEPGKGYDQLVGRAAFQAPDLKRVQPGDPEASYLWRKLEHTAREGKGMPRTLFGSKKLPASELNLIKSWIESGAKP